MLNLNRKPGEAIYIRREGTDEVLTLVVLSIKSDKQIVTLGFENETKEFSILRKEVQERDEGKELPNPFYKDRIPTYWINKKHKKHMEAKEQDTPATEAAVEDLINNMASRPMFNDAK